MFDPVRYMAGDHMFWTREPNEGVTNLKARYSVSLTLSGDRVVLVWRDQASSSLVRHRSSCSDGTYTGGCNVCSIESNRLGSRYFRETTITGFYFPDGPLFIENILIR